jgi:hypothetical protein
MLKSTEVSAVWSEGGRLLLKVLVVMLAAVLLSQAVGVPEEADHPRVLRVRIDGGNPSVWSPSTTSGV